MRDMYEHTVSDVMKPKFDTIDRMATITEAIKAMKHIETKCLIVERHDEKDKIGLLLLSDISRLVLAKDKAPDRVNVYEVMIKPVLSVEPKMSVSNCARLFDQFDLSRAPVVENRVVVGIVSFTDLVLKGFTK